MKVSPTADSATGRTVGQRAPRASQVGSPQSINRPQAQALARPHALTRLQAFLRRAPWQCLSGTELKWIAVVCMAIDHFAASLVWSQYLLMYQHFDPGATEMYDLYIWLRRIGRITFPIFCFVLVEGFTHTRSKPKYVLRLLLFAIVSEVPYDLALHDEVTFTSQINVMFTLLLGLCALWVADEVGRRLKLPAWATSLLTVAALLGAIWLADEKRLDVSYHTYGIMLIGLLYLARDYRLLQVLLGCLAAWWYCAEYNSTLQMWSIAGLVLLLLYDGTRGRGMKYFFYVFYPLHLLIFGLLKMWLF